MFIEKENYFYIEEFEKYGITAVYTKKMQEICLIIVQLKSGRRNTEKIGKSY